MSERTKGFNEEVKELAELAGTDVKTVQKLIDALKEYGVPDRQVLTEARRSIFFINSVNAEAEADEDA